MLDLVLALLAGVVTVAAPCTLPVLPILLGASVGQTGGARPALIALGFATSFSAAALFLSAIAGIFDFDPEVLRSAAAILLLGFGLLMVWPTPLERVSARVGGSLTGIGSASPHQGNLGGFVLGTTLGLVWTPCAGPVLGAILTAIATSPDREHGVLLLLTYSIGAALPMLAVAYGGQAISTRLRRVAPYIARLQQAFRVIVIELALSAFLQYDAIALAWLGQFFPEGRLGL